jgi:replication initiation and membrane attachment protein
MGKRWGDINMELKKVVVYNGYIVTSASMLNDNDRKILTLLYQPLCGYGALALYFTLWSKYESIVNYNAKCDHRNLFSNMDCTVEEFESFRDKLEGLGLIKTLVKEGITPTYCYELYAPLAPQEFFKHELLGTLLKQKLDDENYDKLKSLFVVHNETSNDFYDVTHTFNEVYNLDMNDTSSLKSVIGDKDELAQRKNAKIGTSFSLEIFLMVLKENKIRKNLINSSFVELMESMANLYRLDEYELCNILIASIEGLGTQERINYEIFKRKCFEYRKVMKVSNKDVKALEDKKKGVNKKVEMLQELEPFQYLRILQGNMEPSKQDIKLIEDLSLMTKLDPGVINVLLDYVMFNKQNTLPYNYVMKVATSLVRENISTAMEAIEYFKSFKTRYNNSKKEIVNNDAEPKCVKEEARKVSKEDVPGKTPSKDDMPTKKADNLIDEALELEKLKKARKERKKNATAEV